MLLSHSASSASTDLLPQTPFPAQVILLDKTPSHTKRTATDHDRHHHRQSIHASDMDTANYLLSSRNGVQPISQPPIASTNIKSTSQHQTTGLASSFPSFTLASSPSSSLVHYENDNTHSSSNKPPSSHSTAPPSTSASSSSSHQSLTSLTPSMSPSSIISLQRSARQEKKHFCVPTTVSSSDRQQRQQRQQKQHSTHTPGGQISSSFSSPFSSRSTKNKSPQNRSATLATSVQVEQGRDRSSLDEKSLWRFIPSKSRLKQTAVTGTGIGTGIGTGSGTKKNRFSSWASSIFRPSSSSPSSSSSLSCSSSAEKGATAVITVAPVAPTLSSCSSTPSPIAAIPSSPATLPAAPASLPNNTVSSRDSHAQKKQETLSRTMRAQARQEAVPQNISHPIYAQTYHDQHPHHPQSHTRPSLEAAEARAKAAYQERVKAAAAAAATTKTTGSSTSFSSSEQPRIRLLKQSRRRKIGSGLITLFCIIAIVILILC